MRHLRRTPRLRPIAMIAAAALAAGGLLVIGSQVASALPGAVTGTVFQDFNSNGRFDSGNTPQSGIANDQGFPGITVTAYDALNTVLDSTVSLADGTYELNGMTNGEQVRIEFTGLPEGFESSFKGAEPGVASGTSVQFTTVGTESIDYAVLLPDLYNQGNPYLFTPVNTAGARTNPLVVNRPALVAYPWNSTNATVETTLATQGEVGSLWGTAYSKSENALFASAVVKRGTGMGPLGIGGIYRLSNVLTPTGGLSGAATLSQWLDVQDLPIQGGGTIDLGTISSDADRGLAGPVTAVRDPEGFTKAGKTGILGIAVSEDGKTLYFINGNDRELYALDITDGNVPTVAVRIPLGLSGDQRPWAVEVHAGQVYVGYVNSGENDTDGLRASGDFTIVSTPHATPGVWTTVLEEPLTYPRNIGTYGQPTPAWANMWRGWVDVYSWPSPGAGEPTTMQYGSTFQLYPQPILSDISFDSDGYLTFAMMDRNGMQSVIAQLSPFPPSNATTTGRVMGDVLVASPNPDGSFTLENNSVVGDRGPTAGQNTNAGPGGGEHYVDSTVGAGELEGVQGALAQIGGVNQAGMIMSDPVSVNTSGMGWFGIDDGAKVSAVRAITLNDLFNKAQGLGAVSEVALAAPVQIGNRVWFDGDQNGRQDADEPPVPNVTVQLRDSGGTIIGTTVTDANGEYYFSSNTPGSLLVPNAEYSVQFVLPTDGDLFTGDPRFGTVPWTDVLFTTQRAVGVGSTVDSDPDASGDTGLFEVGGPGHNDHTIDAGLIANAYLRLVKAIDPEGFPAAPGQIFELNVAATDFRGATFAPPAGTSFDVTVGPGGAVTVPMPVGTSVTITETPDPTVESYSVSPTGPTLVNGSAQSPTIVTVTNRMNEQEPDDNSFSIEKTLSGSGASLPELQDLVFQVEYTTDPEDNDSWVLLEVTPGEVTQAGVAFPPGTVISLRELVPPVVGGVTWGTPAFTGTTIVDGFESFTIAEDEEVAITVDNPAEAVAGFTVTKTVTGTGADSLPVGLEFTVHYETDDPDFPSGDLVVQAGGEVGLDGLDVGTTVTLSEIVPVHPYLDWGTPVFTVDGVPSDDTVTFTLTSLTTVAVALENPVTLITNDVEIRKLISGDEGEVGEDFIFDVDYSWVIDDLSGAGTVQVVRDESVTIQGIPVGAVLTLSESTPSLPGVGWGLPVWSGPGVTDNLDGTATVTVTDDTEIVIDLENIPDRIVGGFSGAKRVTGSGAGQVPAGTTFQLEVQLLYPDNSSDTATVNITTSTGFYMNELPTGTVVTLTELTLPVIPGVEWGEPVWRVDGVDQPAGDVVQFTITEPGTAIDLELINDAQLVSGSFSIQKDVTGPGEAVLTPGFEFTGAYDYPGRPGGPGAFTVVNGGTFTLPADEVIAEGTVVTISEITPTGGLPAGYNWGTPAYIVDGGPPSAGPIEITIGDDTTVAVVIDNPTTANNGSFSITKSVTGPAGATFPTDYVFTGTYDYPGRPGGPGVFGVSIDTPFVLPADELIMLGTQVTFTEDPLDGAVLPDGIGWGTPRWLVGGLEVTPATITIGNETTVELSLVNPTLQPRVMITKGDGAGTTIEHEADTITDAEVYAPGETRTIVIRAVNDGNEDLVDVELTDVTLSGAIIQSLVWTFPDGTTTAASLSGDTWSAQWEETFDPGRSQVWEPGDVITGVATLTITGEGDPHADEISVDAEGAFTGIPVEDDNRYYAYSAAIQLIKYDGEKPDPAVQDGDTWITPVKPMADPFQDANTVPFAVKYPVDTPQSVRMVATNTGQTWLTEVIVADTTLFGPNVTSIIADLSPLGGPAEWDFLVDGAWPGPWEPGTSFFLEGVLELPKESLHGNNAVITAVVVVPLTDADGIPTNEPTIVDGVPLQAQHPDGSPWTLTDSDPFHAYTPGGLPVTGGDAANLPWPLGILLLVGGLVLLLIARRRPAVR